MLDVYIMVINMIKKILKIIVGERFNHKSILTERGDWEKHENER